MLSIFSCACWASVCLLWRNVYTGPLLIFQLGCLVFFVVELYLLYIWEIKPLLVESFAKVFSHSVGGLFVFLIVSFAVQKLLSLIRFHWFICVFFVIILGDVSNKIALIYVKERSVCVFL